MQIRQWLHITILAISVTTALQAQNRPYASYRDCFKNSVFEWSGGQSDKDSPDYFEFYCLFSYDMELLVQITENRTEPTIFMSFYGFSDSPNVDLAYYELPDHGDWMISYSYYPEIDSIDSQGTANRDMLECQPEFAALGTDNIHPWDRVERPSYEVYKAIYKYDKSIAFDVVGEFLRVEIAENCSDSLLLTEGEGSDKVVGALNRGELVEIIARSGAWTHVRSLRTGAVGWAEAPCLE